MPLVAPDILKPKKINLPSSNDLPEDQKEWVMLEVGPMLGADLVDVDTLTTPLALKYEMLVNRLLEWNVRDIDGTVAPINKDTVKRLPNEDLLHLIGEVNKEEQDVELPKELPNSL